MQSLAIGRLARYLLGNHSPDFSEVAFAELGFAGRLFLFLESGSVLDGPVLDGNEPGHTPLEAKLAAIIAPRLEAMGFELVRVAILGRDRPTIQVMADRADGSQISVDDCEQISHDVGAAIDVDDPLPTAWTLEVSSAGIDRPLTRTKDWNRFAGHQARVETFLAQNGRRRFSGVVLGADESTARLRLDDGSEAIFRLADVRRAKLVLTDALIAATATPPRAN